MGKILKEFSNKKMALKKTGCVFIVGFSLLLFTATAWSAIADYVGAYYGVYTGADTGNWIGMVEPTGNIVFLAWSTNNHVIDSDDGITIDDDGNFSGMTTAGNLLSGTIDLAGIVDGTWTRGPVGGDLDGQGFSPADVAQFVGTYSGTFSGDDTGTWSMNVDATGYISGTFTGGAGTATMEGGIGPNGRFFLIQTTNSDVGASGTIASGVVSGEWSDSGLGEGGTLTNQAGGGGGDTGGGGGGGCFISTLSR